MSDRCPHVDQIRSVAPSGDACEDCLREGGTWLNLRQCLVCGHVGCCNSSPNTHANRHYRGTGHPIMRSAMPGQDWLWCYVCELTLRSVEAEAGPEGRPAGG